MDMKPYNTSSATRWRQTQRGASGLTSLTNRTNPDEFRTFLPSEMKHWRFSSGSSQLPGEAPPRSFAERERRHLSGEERGHGSTRPRWPLQHTEDGTGDGNQPARLSSPTRSF